MVEHKDVVIGILGASSAFAGLILVFGGFIFSQAASFPSSTDDQIIGKYTRAGRLAIYPFWGFLVTTLLSIGWMLYQAECVYILCVTLFLILVVGTGFYGTLMFYKYL
jgi:hypothetical protein